MSNNQDNIGLCVPYSENCVVCYYSDGTYCSQCNKKINKHSHICWCYRDSITMRVSDYFQDDNEDFYDCE